MNPYGLRGEANGHSKLTEKEVIEIRTLYALGNISQDKLAEEYGVSQVHIGNIVNWKSWTHID